MDINKKLNEIKEKINRLSLNWLESSQSSRVILDKDEEYTNTFKVLKAIYHSLCKYIDNKETIDYSIRYIEHNEAYKELPMIQLDSNKKQLLQDEFGNNYCLDDEQKNKMKKLRKTKQPIMKKQLDSFLMNAK